MNKPLFQLIFSQIKEFVREPGALFWSFIFPIAMAWGLGMAFSDHKEIIRSVAIVSNKGTHDSLLNKFLNRNTTKILSHSEDGIPRHEKTIKNNKLGNVTYRFLCTSWDSAVVLLKRGNVNMILTENKKGIQYHFDPANPEAQLIQMQLPLLINNQVVNMNTEAVNPLTIAGTRYIDFLVPGLMAMGVMMSCLWGVSYTLIEKRSKRLLRRMVATPLKKSHFLMAQLITRILITFCESLVLIVFAYYYFHLTIQGSLLALMVLFLAGNFAFIGIAILISSHTSNVQMGNGLINAVVTPMMLLSGIFFSYHNFPSWAVIVIKVLPLTIFADSVRSIFIEGAGLMQASTSIIILTLTGVVTFGAGLKFYKWF